MGDNSDCPVRSFCSAGDSLCLASVPKRKFFFAVLEHLYHDDQGICSFLLFLYAYTRARSAKLVHIAFTPSLFPRFLKIAKKMPSRVSVLQRPDIPALDFHSRGGVKASYTTFKRHKTTTPTRLFLLLHLRRKKHASHSFTITNHKTSTSCSTKFFNSSKMSSASEATTTPSPAISCHSPYGTGATESPKWRLSSPATPPQD